MSLLKRKSLSAFPQLPLASQLSEEMNRLMEREFPLLGRHWETLGGQWQPDVDIEQKANEYLITVDIPGVDPKDISVSMDNGMLTIEGKRESKVEEKKENYRCIEREYGSFYRSFSLPDAGESDKIKAHVHNGVLEITVPKLESTKQKKIEVHVD
ncbi:Hsp20/alpha crystallin family protein [Marinobacter sp. NP-4(2019)]|uniref:Hsp20/alpha crystallin family protein n=1 Tax=Marinobacter sp. NP-4(2019) TaxID=2488665 RepID=UPI0013DFC8CC|nr:Hsp20/alpha crystallin family protein [Marinobacter sp. NP-4(2019)]